MARQISQGNKRPREGDVNTSETKRRAESKSEQYYEDKSASTLEETSSSTLLVQPSSSSVRASARKSARTLLESDISSNSRTSATRQDSSRRHTSSSTSAHTDRGRTKAVIDHPHLSRVVEMSDQGKSAIRADLGMNFDPWDPRITQQGERLVTLALWKREVHSNQRYVPDYSDQKAEYHRTSHDGNIKVGMKAFRDFFQKPQEWTYQEGVNHLHEDFHKYHLRNHIPRVVGEHWKILNNPKSAAYMRCIPVDCYYEEILRDTPGFKQQALPHSSYRAKPTSPMVKSEKLSKDTLSNTLRNNSGSPEPSPLYTWSDEVIGDEKEKRYRVERLSLDEITEVERLAELINSIKAGNPPGYYSAMKEKEVEAVNLLYTTMKKEEGRNYKPGNGQIPSWASVTYLDFSTEILESAYDSHQIEKIKVRIVRIKNTAVESDDEHFSDGPGGQWS
jgi:hypothetical protein